MAAAAPPRIHPRLRRTERWSPRSAALRADEPRRRQQRPAHDGSAADRQGQPEWLEPAAHELRQDCDRAGGERREDAHPRQACLFEEGGAEALDPESRQRTQREHAAAGGPDDRDHARGPRAQGRKDDRPVTESRGCADRQIARGHQPLEGDAQPEEQTGGDGSRRRGSEHGPAHCAGHEVGHRPGKHHQPMVDAAPHPQRGDREDPSTDQRAHPAVPDQLVDDELRHRGSHPDRQRGRQNRPTESLPSVVPP